MKITFIRPSIGGLRARDAMEPLAFASLAALTPRDVQLAFHDERLQPLPPVQPADLVALTVETYTARRAYQIAASYRARGIPVVMGGYHPTLLPAEAARFADALVLGDAEEVWPQVITDARAGRLQPIYRSGSRMPLDGLRFDRSIFAGSRYGRIAPVQFGRGCRYACDFCSIHAFYGSNVRTRPVAEVVAEIESLGRRCILLVDDNLFVNRAKARELFEALIPLKISWGCQVSIDVARDRDLLKLMARSGCIAALVGFESLNEANLAQMRKKWNLAGGSYADAIDRFHDHGIMVYGSFVFGYDDDTPDTFEHTAEFALRARLFLVNFSVLTPTPGTALLERFREQGRMTRDRWWLDPTYRFGEATFRPARMTPDQLTEGTLRARWMFYRYTSIASRFFNVRANCRGFTQAVAFVAGNFITRGELRRKLGHGLGADVPLEVPEFAGVPQTVEGATV